MSTYEPGRLYLIDVYGVTRTVHYGADGFFRCGEDFGTTYGASLNVRPAIVLDPEVVTKQTSNAGSELAENRLLADMVRAQITPPEPPMEEPTEWGTVVRTDEGRAILLDPDNDAASLTWFIEGRGWAGWLNLKNPHKYENPREKPATGAESDAQGSAGGIGRVGPIPDGIAWCCLDDEPTTPKEAHP